MDEGKKYDQDRENIRKHLISKKNIIRQNINIMSTTKNNRTWNVKWIDTLLIIIVVAIGPIENSHSISFSVWSNITHLTQQRKCQLK